MLNPILSFSATRRMRSFKTLLIAAVWLLVMMGVALLIMGQLFRSGASINGLRTGVTCYQILIIVQFILIILVAPAMTSGAIAGDRERQTLELLLVTNTRSFRIVWGKAMESFAMLALLIVCGFPVMCMTMIAGAVTILQILAGELFLLAMAFAAVCVGVLSSALARSTVGSSILSYVILLSIGLLTTLPLLADVGKELTSRVYDQAKYAAMAPEEAMGLLSPVLFINPGFALLALLQGQTGLLTSRLEYQDQGRILYYFSLMNRAGGQTVTLICCGAITLLALALIIIAALILRGTSLKPAKRTKVNA
jgi:ABC-type transport system involved in multi-copper enzyme maturation permease subunit